MDKLTDDSHASFHDKALNFFTPVIELLLSPFGKNNSEWDELPIEYTPIIAQPHGLETFYLKAVRYYHYILYQKAIEILDSVYSGYSDHSHQYIFPSHELEDLYQQILKPFTVIDSRYEFRQLPIMGLKSFPSLFDKADEHIKSWDSIKQAFEDDLTYLASTIPQIYRLSYDLEHTFREIDRELAELTAQKDNTLYLAKPDIRGADDVLFIHGPITINITRATFKYEDNQSKTININNREFRFFMYLFHHKGKVINYIDFVAQLNLNVSTKGLDVSQAQDLIRDIKKMFGKRLKELGVEKDDVTTIMDSIVAINSQGYKLIDIS